MTNPEMTAKRVREAFRILIENGAPMPRAAVWDEVAARLPLSDEELVPVQTGRANGEVDFNWQTATSVKAGWLVKGGADGWSITDAGRAALEEFSDPLDFMREARNLYTEWDRSRTEAKERALGTQILPFGGQAEIVRASKIFVDRSLVAGESAFAPGRQLWRESVVSELENTFGQAVSVPGLTFIEQLETQLADASDDAKLLMAELVALQLLPISTGAIGAIRKTKRIEGVLQLMDHPVQIPSEISHAFDFGAYHPGTYMSSNLGAAMTIVVNFAAAWIRSTSDAREELLEDPWAFKRFVLAVDGDSGPSQRSSLMYTIHPESFVSVVSDDHKRLILEAFQGELTASTGETDRDLRDITLALQVKNKGAVNYYGSPLREKWSPSREPVHVVEGGSESELGTVRSPFPRVTPELSAELFVDEIWAQEQLDLLERKKQLILYGPPGTGKTFIAKALARHISSGTEATLVQFHPSYSYEDFVQGFRPVVEEAGLAYRLKDGPFLRLASQARNNPESNYVLVIDEINRGNIAKVFGELYFLLEYRDDRINLLYGEDTFDLPSNVFIIGTMNTTDRSIALLDAAMRRRFAFVELHPDKPPTSGVLRRWLTARGLDEEAALLLDALNSGIRDASARIGPSYLMPRDGDLSDERLRQIWRYEIMPLLEEAHYGEDRDLDAEFGLDALRRRISSSAADA